MQAEHSLLSSFSGVTFLAIVSFNSVQAAPFHAPTGNASMRTAWILFIDCLNLVS